MREDVQARLELGRPEGDSPMFRLDDRARPFELMRPGEQFDTACQGRIVGRARRVHELCPARATQDDEFSRGFSHAHVVRVTEEATLRRI